MAEVPRCLVVVRDANDNPIVGANVTVDGITKATEVDGMVGFGVATTPTHSVTVDAEGFVTEQVTFSGTIEAADWNNSLVTREAHSDRSVLTVRLGRLDVAPTKPVPSADELNKLAAAHADVQAVFVEKLARQPSSGQWPVYRDVYYVPNPTIGQSLDPLPVWLTNTTLLPPAPNPGAVGWRHFTGQPADPPADSMAFGRFFWMVHQSSPKGRGAKNGPFAVALWSPNINRDTPIETLDMVVLFSPTTAHYQSRYPFGVVPGGGPGEPANQEYISQGGRYIFDEYSFVYDLIARGRQAVFVMPICRQGDWGPYASGEGIFRLCREVSLFLHRECRTSNKALLSSDGVPRDTWHAGGTLRSPSISGIFGSDFGNIPKPGRIAVSGFSNGIMHVKQLMAKQGWGVTKGYEQRFWGCPYIRVFSSGTSLDEHDPRNQWAQSWRELWDLDGYHKETGGWPAYLNLIKSWAFDEDPTTTRMVRLCHSLEQPDPKTASHPTWKAMKDETPGVSVQNYDIPGAREMQGGNGGRWSAVHLDRSVVDVGPELPWLGFDAHHGAPKISFSYFTALSPIGLPT